MSATLVRSRFRDSADPVQHHRQATCHDLSAVSAGPVWVEPVGDLERVFLADAELVRIAGVLSELRNLVMGGCVPVPIRREIARLVDGAEVLLRTPYLGAAE